MTVLPRGEKGLMFAADFVDEKACLNCLNSIADYIDGIKIGHLLIVSVGLRIIHKIRQIVNVPIIADFKLMDISPIATSLIHKGIEFGLDGFMMCGVCGPDVLKDCISVGRDKMIFVFTEFTHFTGLIDRQLSNYVAEMARDFGAFGIQAPATKPIRVRELRQIVGEELVIMSCGVGEQGASYGSAIKNGADYEIVGRSIYLAQNPRSEAQKAKTNIQKYATRNNFSKDSAIDAIYYPTRL